jgi:CRP/FNR family transcriptional regulator, cyclic AMP receptor protein
MSSQPSSTAARDEIVVRKGEAIFRQGERGDSMFLIRSGQVRILLECAGHEAAVAMLKPGDFFGELSLLSEATRSATAEALEDTTLLVVSRDVFAMMMQDDIDVVFRMLHTMGERLGRTDRQFREILERHSHIRLLSEALERARDSSQTSVALEVDRLADGLALDRGTARTMIGELVHQGAGTLEQGQWRLDGAAHLAAVVALLRTYADVRGPRETPAGPSAE